MSVPPNEKSSRKRKPKPDHNTVSVDASILAHAPPQNLEAERGVIGALILNPLICDDIVPIVHADDFYSDANRRIYKHLVEMRGSNCAIDVLLLVNRLKESEELERVGGIAYIGELIQSPPVAAHAVYYANIVREKGTLRRLIHASSTILEGAFAPDVSTKELLNTAAQQMFELCESQTVNQISDMKSVMMEAVKYLDNKLKGERTGILTGFGDLDTILDGFHPNELIILAARPGVGKTAFAMNIAENVAVKDKQPVLFVSLEMAKLELATRLICSRGRIDSQRIRKNLLSKTDQDRFYRITAELSETPMFFDDTPTRTVSEIAAVARRLKRQCDLQLLVIDYLGLIAPDSPSDPRQEQVAKIARRLKGLARELHIPILCLAQLNRQVEQGGRESSGVPKLSHLRESGAIEQDADVVMFVHRDVKEKEDGEGVESSSKIIVAKQRGGSTGDVKMLWFPEYTRFESLSKHQESEYSDMPHAEFTGFDGETGFAPSNDFSPPFNGGGTEIGDDEF